MKAWLANGIGVACAVLVALSACSEDYVDPNRDSRDITGDGGVGDARAPVLPSSGPLTLEALPAADVIASRDGSLHATVSGGSGPYRIVWRQTTGPHVLLFGADTLNPSFEAPPLSTRAELSFSITVVDAAAQIASAGLAVAVVPSPLTIATDGEVVIGEQQTARLHAVPTGDIEGITYSWSQKSGQPALTIQQPTSPNPEVAVPALLTDTTFELEVKATNRAGTAAIGLVTLLVRPGGPVAYAGIDNRIGESTGFTLSGQASGGSGPYQYAWTQTSGPAVTLSNPSTATPAFTTPDVDGEVDLGFDLVVTDASGHFARDAVTITVVDPVAGALVVNAGPDTTAAAGGRVQLSAAARGGTGPYAFTWTQVSGPVVTLQAGPTAATRFFQAPSVATATPVAFRVDVTDGTAAAALDTVTLTLQSTNFEAVAGNDVTVTAGETVRLYGTTKNHLGARGWLWNQTGGTAIALTGAGTANPTFVAPATAGALTFQLTATDARPSVDTDTVTVTVVGPPAVASLAGADQIANAGNEVLLQGAGGGGKPPYRYAWAQKGGTPFLSMTGDTTPNPRIRLAPIVADEATLFELTVTDSAGATAKDSVTITSKAPLAAANPEGPEKVGTSRRPLTDAERTINNCEGSSCFAGGTQVVCDERTPFAQTVLSFNGAGGIVAEKRCVNNVTCLRDWWKETSNVDTCVSVLPPVNGSIGEIQFSGAPVRCTYCCVGPNCNLDLLPAPGTIASCEGDICYPPP